jgi:hypothetical protein
MAYMHVLKQFFTSGELVRRTHLLTSAGQISSWYHTRVSAVTPNSCLFMRRQILAEVGNDITH